MGTLQPLLVLTSLLSCAFTQYPSNQYQAPLSTYNGNGNGNGNGNLINCGQCPAGYTREAAIAPYCGKCVRPNVSCGPGYYLNGNGCQSCPCPGNGQNRFGTTCQKDASGQVVCDCPENYSGTNCNQCAPGCVQDNQYPYQCLRPGNNNTQCVGATCQPVAPPPPPPTNPPYQPCPQTSQCPVNPGSPCPSNVTICPVNPGTQCPVNPAPCPVGPSPCPVNPAPCPVGPSPCPVNPAPCPVGPSPCPINPGPGPCPVGPAPCPVNPGPALCPVNPTPCPQCPTIPNCPPCYNNQTCPTCPQCPQCPPQQQCPSVTCPQPPPPQPCPTCPSCQQCPSPCAQCPSPCAQCPAPPPCNPCPNPCPPCGNQICPNPCPPNCQSCPEIPACPQCPNLTCPGVVVPPCPIIALEKEVCICDPRGTLYQHGATCSCKVNVEGYQCSSCKAGYFGLSQFKAEGCSKCFCSGVSNYCKSAVFYTSSLTVSSSSRFRIAEIQTGGITVIQDDIRNVGGLATYTSSTSRKLLWVLPAEFTGNRVTSYGGILSCVRRYSGAGTSLGFDHDIIIVGKRGGIIYWSSFDSQNAQTGLKKFSAVLNDKGGWVVSSDGTSRPANRADILAVLADIEDIYVRASFSSSTTSTSIRDCTLDTVSSSLTDRGFAHEVEQCSCPPGYKGLSCESCSEGYYRDVSDTSKSIFGACKKCPCGPLSIGCRFEFGTVVCVCKSGLTGAMCQDKESLTLTLDPFTIREVANSEVLFTCSYVTNSKQAYTLQLETEPSGVIPKVTSGSTSCSSMVRLTPSLNQVICKLRDSSGMEVACAKSTIQIETIMIQKVISPPPMVSVVCDEAFICINETEILTLHCKAVAYGSTSVKLVWRKEHENGSTTVGSGETFQINSARIEHSGTYCASVTLGNSTAIERISVVVKPLSNAGPIPYPPRDHKDDPNAYNESIILPLLTTTEKSGKSTSGNKTVQEKLPEGHPKVTIEPIQLTVKVGDPAILKCHTSGKAPLKYYWKSGKDAYIPHHVRASHGSLIFQAVTNEDSGDYFCVAWNNIGHTSAAAKLIVLPGNKTVADNLDLRLSIVPDIYEAYAGENVNFQCIMRDPNARIIWSRKTGDLPNSSEVKGDGILTLYRVSEANAGDYLCSAVLPNGQTLQKQGRLTIKSNKVSEPPSVKVHPRSPHKVRSGDRVLLDCHSTGEPTPTVMWTRSIDGKDLQLVVSATPATVYEIPHVTKADEGKYTCTAANDAGTKVESLSLIIDDAIICKSSEFRCKSGDQCVAKDDRCDGEKDCRDGSDEHHCRRQSRTVPPK